MECKGCGRDLTDTDDVKMVAQWPFCTACFAKLLEKQAAPAQEAAAQSAQTAIEGAPIGSTPDSRGVHCEICGVALPGQAFRVGSWSFCAECFRDLVMSPSLPDALETATETAEAGAEAKAPDEEEPGFVARMRVGFLRSVSCAGCGRRIPEGGARLVDERPYCPDCYSKLPPEDELPPGEAKGFRIEASVRTPHGAAAPEASSRCESCGRVLAAERLKEVEGFVICSACLATDPGMAVEIARDRHRAMMEMARNGLGHSE